jgi:hypothetical protein
MKTWSSERIRKNCTEPSIKARKRAIEKNQIVNSFVASTQETWCRLLEESFKKVRQNKKKRIL